jgi:hypothetical protein
VERSRLERARWRRRRRLIGLTTLLAMLVFLSVAPGALALSVPAVQVSVPATGTTVKVDPAPVTNAPPSAPTPSAVPASPPAAAPAPADPAPKPAPAPAQPTSSPAPAPQVPSASASKPAPASIPSASPAPKVELPSPAAILPSKPSRPSLPSTGPVTGVVDKVVAQTLGNAPSAGVPGVGGGPLGPGGGGPLGGGGGPAGPGGGLLGGGGPAGGGLSGLVQSTTSVLAPVLPLGPGGGGPLSPGPPSGQGGGLLGPILGPGGLLGPVTGPGGLLSPVTGPGGLLSPVTGPGGLLSPVTGPGGLLSPVTGPGGVLSPIAGPGGLLGPIASPGGPLSPTLRPSPIATSGGTAPSLPADLTGRPANNLFPAGPGPGASNQTGPAQVGGPSEPRLPHLAANGVGSGVLARSARGADSVGASTAARGPPFASLVSPLQLGGLLFEAGGSSSPAPPSTPAQQTPGGALGAATGSSTSLNLAGFAGLLLLTAWALPRLARRLDEASALWRPMPFLSLLERPG